MDSNEFVVGDKYELLALHRGLLEARFCDRENDADVSGSPILAKLHRRLIIVLVSLDKPVGGSKSQWAAWLQMDEGRREWNVAIDRARRFIGWGGLDSEAKRAAALDFLSPFEVESELVDLFMACVEK